MMPTSLWFLLVLTFVINDKVSALPANPHIVFIVADDLGYNDVGWNNPNMKTPNMDYMAENGIILDKNYVYPLCTPSRVAFMTGRYPHTIGLQHKTIKGAQPNYVPLSVDLLPQKLKAQGYENHMIGKWHLGYCDESVTPTERGFDSFFGFYNGGEDYYSHLTAGYYDFRKDLDAYNPTDHGYTNYSTFAYAERAVEIIDYHNSTNPDTPMFLYMAFQAPHYPLQVPENFENEFSSINDDERRVFSGMVMAMDEAIGAVFQKLNETGMLDKAVIVFTSDNGGLPNNGGYNNPLRGTKGTFWEGGIRVPGFVYSKTELQTTGYKSDKIVHATDWFATFLNLAGGDAALEDIDGKDQWNTLSNNDNAVRTSFVVNFDNYTTPAFWAIRSGEYKLMLGNPGNRDDVYTVPSRRRRSLSKQKRGRRHTYLFKLDDNPSENPADNLYDDSAYQSIKNTLLNEMDILVQDMVNAYYPGTDNAAAEAAAQADGDYWASGWCNAV